MATTFDDVKAKVVLDGFTAAQETSIMDDLETAYEGSAIAKQMFDNWIATEGHTINIKYVTGAYRAYVNLDGTGTGRVEIDPAYIDGLSYINDTGTPILHSQLGALVHELGHALTGRRDNISATDYQGDNVRYINTIWDELGLDKEISYIAQSWDLHVVGYTYTDNTTIDAARTFDGNWSSSALGDSDDLLIGGSSNNTFQGGEGDDFLYGAGGNDLLYGSPGFDTAVYFGSPLDYDIRKNDDGTWSVRNARGTEGAGTDLLVNVEAVQFDGDTAGTHETYRLQKNGLTFQTDFAIVVDTTGSMWDDIDSVKSVAADLIDAAFADGNADARIGVVSFKDNTIGEPTTVVLPFTDQDSFAARKTAALAAIDSLGASGGGDLPETAFDGLHKALDGSMGEWRAGAGILRVALFTDAEVKDTYLAAEVTTLAHNIGAVIEDHTSIDALYGSVDTFVLSFDGSTAAGIVDDGDPMPDFELGDEPMDPETATTLVQIFTIVTGAPSGEPGFDTTSLETIAADNGGGYLVAVDNDALVEALFAIIENAPPTDIQLDNDTIVENSATGAVVGNLSATDPDSGETFTYSLIDNPGNLFAIDGNHLVVSNLLDYEEAASHDITIRVSDFVSNTFDKVFTINVTDVDDSKPTVTDYDPADDATNVEIDSNITVTFSEPVQRGTGLIEIHAGAPDGAVFESYDAATSANLTIDGSTLSIDPSGNLVSDTHYYLTFAEGTILDLAGNAYEDDDDAFHFSTVDAAVSASGGSSDGISAGAVVAGVAGLGLLAFVIF